MVVTETNASARSHETPGRVGGKVGEGGKVRTI